MQLQTIHTHGRSIDTRLRVFTDGMAEYVSLCSARAAGLPAVDRQPDLLRARIAAGESSIRLDQWSYGEHEDRELAIVRYTAALYVWWQVANGAADRGRPLLCADFLHWLDDDYRSFDDACTWLTERGGFDVHATLTGIALDDVLTFVEAECAHNIDRPAAR